MFEVARYEAERRSVGAFVAATGLSLFAALFVYIGNLIGDIVQTRLDPRVTLLERQTGS